MDIIKKMKRILYFLMILSSILLIISAIVGFVTYLIDFDERAIGFSALCGVLSFSIYILSGIVKMDDEL